MSPPWTPLLTSTSARRTPTLIGSGWSLSLSLSSSSAIIVNHHHQIRQISERWSIPRSIINNFGQGWSLSRIISIPSNHITHHCDPLQEGQGAFAAGHKQSEAEHLHQVSPFIHFSTLRILSPQVSDLLYKHYHFHACFLQFHMQTTCIHPRAIETDQKTVYDLSLIHIWRCRRRLRCRSRWSPYH